MKMEFVVQNIVATASLGEEVDLNALFTRLHPAATYNPEDFPGLVLHMKFRGRKFTFLIFSSGKMVCTGARSSAEVKHGLRALASVLRKLGLVRSGKVTYTIQNIVATSRIGYSVDLEGVAMLVEGSLYEPEQFPGVILKLADPKATFLLFNNGKVVCTGVPTEEELGKAISRVAEKLAGVGIATKAEQGAP